MMIKRLPLLMALLLGGLVLTGADGCSSDPNVEGAKLDFRNKDYDRALQNLNTALEKDPDNAEALQWKGRVIDAKLAEVRDPAEHEALFKEMTDAFRRAMELNPEAADEIEQEMRVAFFNEFQRGIDAFNRGRSNEAEYSTAVGHFQNATYLMPDSAGPYVNQAYAMLNSGQAAQAIEPFERAIELGEDDSDSYSYLATLYMENGRAADAIPLLQEGTEKYPENADLQAQLLNAYLATDQIDEAVAQYGRAVENDPENKLFRYNYGTLLLQLSRYEEAIEQFAVAVDLDPEYANAQYNLGASYINLAVDINEQIQEMDDKLREDRDGLSADQQEARQAEIDALVERRRSMFERAIEPLEMARELTEMEGEDSTAICRALFQSYVQTNNMEAAEDAEACMEG